MHTLTHQKGTVAATLKRANCDRGSPPSVHFQVAIVAPEAILDFHILRLEGIVEDGESSNLYTYTWSELNRDLLSRSDLSDFLRTETTTGPNIAFDSGFLEAGVTYAFRLSVTDPSTGV